MPSPRAPGRTHRARRQRQSARRARRFAGLVVLGAVVVATLLLTAFGAARPAATTITATVMEQRLAPSQPTPQVVARYGELRLDLPVAQSRLTALGYHAGGPGALPLEPLGRQGNRGLLRRVLDGLFGEERAGLVWYQLPSGRGAGTSALAVGGAPGTDVFAPVDGTVIGIGDFVLDGKRYGSRIDIQPAAAPSLVVSVSRVQADPALTVGATVVAAANRLGRVLDLSKVERQALAEFTQDAGNHVTVQVRAAATSSVP